MGFRPGEGASPGVPLSSICVDRFDLGAEEGGACRGSQCGERCLVNSVSTPARLAVNKLAPVLLFVTTFKTGDLDRCCGGGGGINRHVWRYRVIFESRGVFWFRTLTHCEALGWVYGCNVLAGTLRDSTRPVHVAETKLLWL